MPNLSITTTAIQAFAGDVYLKSLVFKVPVGATGTIYLKNMRHTLDEVSSSSYDFSLQAGESGGGTIEDDGDDLRGPWRAVGTGTTTLEIIPSYRAGRRS